MMNLRSTSVPLNARPQGRWEGPALHVANIAQVLSSRARIAISLLKKHDAAGMHV